MGLVYAAVLPHGPGVIAELAADPAVMAATRDAMTVAGGRFAAARPDVVLLLDPHSVHEAQGVALAEVREGRPTAFPNLGSRHIAVCTASRAGGTMGGAGGGSVTDTYAGAPGLAAEILAAGAGLPVVAEPGGDGGLRLAGGALIPLWFTLRMLPEPRPPLLVIDAGPAVARTDLWRFGAVLTEWAERSGQRVALLASADQGHTHDPGHERFGYSPAAAEHDRWYCAAIRDQRLDRLLSVADDLLRGSWSDSLWQTLILAGAVEAAGLHGDLLSYAVPTYYGLAVAVYDDAEWSNRGQYT